MRSGWFKLVWFATGRTLQVDETLQVDLVDLSAMASNPSKSLNMLEWISEKRSNSWPPKKNTTPSQYYPGLVKDRDDCIFLAMSSEVDQGNPFERNIGNNIRWNKWVPIGPIYHYISICCWYVFVLYIFVTVLFGSAQKQQLFEQLQSC